MTDPEQALRKCHDAGLVEETWITDPRAGRCKINEMGTTVYITTEDGQPIAIGVTELFDSYQNGSVQIAEAP